MIGGIEKKPYFSPEPLNWLFSMSSKRGRKRNDNLPPNRARDVQRAFRARRAAHLQVQEFTKIIEIFIDINTFLFHKALEERVSELEDENDCLRQALSLPPSSRPPLGRGPTGKDRPRTFDTSSLQSLSPHSRESSTDLSPTSRPSSQSPTSMATSMSSRPAAVMEPSAWNESMVLNNQSHQTQQHSDLVEPSNSPYHMSAMPAQAVSPKQYISYDNPIPSSSRQLSSDVYLSSPNAYTQSPDRPIDSNYGNQNFSSRGEIREEIRHQYVYTHPYQHDLNMPVRSQSPSSSSISQSHPHVNNLQRDSTIPFSHRRSSLDHQGFSIGQGFPRLPNPVQLQHNPRPPDLPRQPDHIHAPTNPRPAHYGQDGRFNPVP
jgi:hypothetical protein